MKNTIFLACQSVLIFFPRVPRGDVMLLDQKHNAILGRIPGEVDGIWNRFLAYTILCLARCCTMLKISSSTLCATLPKTMSHHHAMYIQLLLMVLIFLGYFQLEWQCCIRQ